MSVINLGYSKELSEEKFWTKVGRYAKKLGGEAVHKAICLWLVIKDPEAPAWAKSVAIAALGYLIFPIDVIPDPLPGGLTDDIATIIAAFVTVSMYLTVEIQYKAKMMMPQWFRE